MALLPRLRHHLALEARRVAGALLRLADGAEPEPRGPGDPPAHWLAVVRARAPQLLEGRGIGVRVEEVVEPEPDVVADAPPSKSSPGFRPPDWPGARPEVPGRADSPEAADAATGQARWPRVGRTAQEPLAWSRAHAAEPGRPEWPALPDAGTTGVEWPAIEPASVVGATWPSRRTAAPAPPEWLASRRGEPSVLDWPDVGSSPAVPRYAAEHERARPARLGTGSWPAPAEPPTGATGRWPVPSRNRRRSPEPGVADARKPSTTTPSSVSWAGPRPASEASFDGGSRGRWPSLPDDEEQRRLPVALDTTDGERVRRLDAEQRGR